MSRTLTVESLAKAIQGSTKASKFCVSGCLPVGVDPGLEVESLGRVEIPLKRGKAQKLVARARPAPYGKGTATLVDKNVRNTFELDASDVRLSDKWNTAIADALRPIAEQLGLPADNLEARLYKLLVYEKGGFFLPHRDSEKHDRMVASLIVTLPNPFDGGALVVRHGSMKETLKFKEAAVGGQACFAAFYADCEHEVERVSGGERLCLAYNLVLKQTRAAPVVKARTANVLADAIGSWFAKQPAEPLVFALDHHYTQRGLSLDLLKGNDRQLADMVVSAAEELDCRVYFSQVSRHLLQWADDGSSGYDDYRDDDEFQSGDLEIGETYEDELTGTEWFDLKGKKQPWKTICFELSAIVSTTPIDDWKPTSEEFEGYTGNAGNSLDRWYHRSAIVVWRRDRHFEIVAGSGMSDSVPLLVSMVQKLSTTPMKRMDEAYEECVQFCRAIVTHWPKRYGDDYETGRHSSSPYEQFIQNLLVLKDRDTVALFLAKVAERDRAQRLGEFVVAVCREFGWGAFARELKQLIATSDPAEIVMRDAEWLAAFCCDTETDADKPAVADELLTVMVGRFCAPRPERLRYHRTRREATVSERSLRLLVKSLIVNGRDEDVSRVIRFTQQLPDDFGIDTCVVPTLKELIPWSRKHCGVEPPAMADWLATTRRQLETATEKSPEPPADWARPANVACKCRYCGELNTFLADPANKIGRIPANDETRHHLTMKIQRHECDVEHTIERKGRPFPLLLTKTRGSFDRAVKQYKADLRLLSELPS